jgi:general secretion pathway protein G
MRRVLPSPGFTLIELLVVMAVLGLLVSLAAPRYFQSIDKARESTLRENLMQFRQAIDRHFGDTGKYPASLEDLVAKKYLRRIPADPLTDRTDTWIVVAPDDRASGIVFDVKSGAKGQGRDGTQYASW